VDYTTFTDYLTETLIPDLRESGRDATADDFETCLRFMANFHSTLESVQQMTFKNQSCLVCEKVYGTVMGGLRDGNR
jgi:hypothetical protein